ncbi:MAG: 50S ribosomal protein L23 [Patescibacteria group bacterium]
MGLITNFLHRKQKKEQLSKIGEKQSASVVVEEKKVKTENKTEHKVKLTDKSLAFRVLVKPLVTEKSAIAENGNKYSFVVAKSANKNQIKIAIEEIYGVKPSQINVANIEGRRVRFGRTMGKRNDYKKAIITLPEGKTIDIHTGV